MEMASHYPFLWLEQNLFSYQGPTVSCVHTQLSNVPHDTLPFDFMSNSSADALRSQNILFFAFHPHPHETARLGD